MKNKVNLRRFFVIFTVLALLVSAGSASGINSVNVDLSISDSYGTIKDKYVNNYSDLFIVHIQDLHCNYDAQMSIYKAVDKLIKEDKFKLVTVEGSVGKLETAPFSGYPDEEIKQKVAEHFVKRGKIGGTTYAHILNKSSFAFWGADDTTLYQGNVSAFKVSLANKADNNAFCDNIKGILDTFKQKVYSRKLQDFDKQIRAYKNDEITFQDYAVYLNGLINEYKIEKEPFPNFNKLIEVLALEKDIDFTLVDTQRSECIEALSKSLKGDELSKLLDTSLHFKTGTVGAMEFYSYLKALMEKNKKVSPDKYQELAKYISYILSYNTIEHLKLFEEIELAEAALKDKLFTREIERSVDTLSKNIEVLKNLANLKLTTKTLDYYRKNRSVFLASNFINFISENAAKYRIKYKLDPSYRNIDGRLPDLEKFYTLALERDKALVDNTINKMNQISEKRAVLIAGGFHTEGITDALKKKGISYVVITPKVNELDEKNNPYISVLLNEKTPFEKLLYEQVMKNKRKDPEAIVFQQEAKYLAEALKLAKEVISKQENKK